MNIHLTYLEDSCIIHLMYLEVRDSSYVPERFVNLYIMVLIVAIMKDLSTFLDNSHYYLLYGDYYERPFNLPR